MTESVPPDGNDPFFFPPPTTTASDLLGEMEEKQRKKLTLDSRLLATLPNCVASSVVRTCEVQARFDHRSARIHMAGPDILGCLPSHAVVSMGEQADVFEACGRILDPLGAKTLGILTGLGFKSTATVSADHIEFEVSW